MTDLYPPRVERKKVGGVAVVADEVLESGLSKGKPGFIPIKGIRVLTLANGEVTHGCRDCLMDGTLGEVRKHRHADHNEAHAGSKRTPAGPVISPEALEWTLAELLALAEHVNDWSEVLDNITRQRDDALAGEAEKSKELAAERRAHTALKNKLSKLVEV